MHDHEQLKHFLDAASLSAAFGSLLGWLPHLAALLSIIWSLIRIYDRFNK